MRTLIAKHPVLSFVLATLAYQFLVVGFVWWRLPEGGHMHDDEAAHTVFRLRVFGPLVFAVAFTAYLEGRAGLRNLFSGYLKWRVPGRWYVLALTWKFLYTYLGIVSLFLLGLRAWPGFVVHDFFEGTFVGLRNLAISLPFIIGIALVEETAWMKYCVTRMQERYTAFTSCLLVGLSWGLWYLPMLLVGEGTPDGYLWPVFLVSMVCLTILLGWTYNMTRSGVVLLIMQIVSNCAFFVIPVLPGWHGLDSAYVNSFVAFNFISAVVLVLVYGGKELGKGPRARWSEGMPDQAPSSQDDVAVRESSLA
ncbi:MAG: CPBP family intramembrane metalloprotease [Flavobacteriales bacterium]|nr:CPBP family intramembrane metalloprotease [Flavobacteriales bacterium]